MTTKNAAAPTANRGGQKPAGQRGQSDSDHTTIKPQRSTFLDHALAYAARGWWVFPLKPGTKQPITKHGFKDASNDPKAIRAWWGKTPRANIGLDCGRSGVLVIDVDGDEGLNTLADLEAARGLVYHTLTSHTPGKIDKGAGLHLLFRMPEGLTIGNKKISPGLETRGAGGYIVLSPSIHPDHPKGPAYRWAADTTPIADLPQVFIDLITAQPESTPAAAASIPLPAPARSISQHEIEHYSQAAFDDELVKLRAAREGDRNNQLNRSAFALGQFVGAGALDQSSVVAELEQAARDIGLNGKEVIATIKSGVDDGRARPRDLSHLADRRNGHHGSDTPPARPTDAPARMLTDLGNGQRMTDLYGRELRYTMAWGWYVWNKRQWLRDETGQVMRRAKATVLSIFDEAKAESDRVPELIDRLKHAAEIEDAEASERLMKMKQAAEKRAASLSNWAVKSQAGPRLSEMIRLAQSERQIAAHHKQFDRESMLFNCQNGALSLFTGELLPHDPERLITKICGTHYDPAATCPTWLAFLNRIMAGNQEMIDFLQRSIGYSLTGDVDEQCLFFLYGTGKNGKTVFTSTLQYLLGDYAARTPTETLLTKRGDSGIPNDIARLPGARLVIAAELPDGRRLNESLIKDLTGGDMMTARFLHREFFEFKPTFKLWIYGNHKPVIRGTDEGIWRRIRMIPFTVTIPQHERDPKLTDKLRVELPGILAWAMRGCATWIKSGLSLPDEVKAATDSYRAEQDEIGTFINECCVFNAIARVKTKDLFGAFNTWRGDSLNKRGITPQWFNARMRERGYTDERGAGNVPVWKGIGLIDEKASQND